MTHLIAFDAMDCGCYPDEDVRFMNVCNKHWYAPMLINAILASEKQMDDKVQEAMNLCHGVKEAKKDGG